MSAVKIKWIDILKFIGIVAVILGHIHSPFGGFIFSWHMPLFFIISGFFINLDLTSQKFLSKEFKRLIIPYFLFVILALMIESSKRFVLHRDPLNFYNEMNGALVWMDMEGLINSYAFILWFLPALFIAKYLVYIIKKHIKNSILQYFVVIFLFLISFEFQLPFAIDNGLNVLLFIYIGNYLLLQSDRIIFVILSLIIIIGIYSVSGIPSLNISEKQYDNILLNIGWSISIVYLLIFIVSKVGKSPKIIILWGSNTMLLFIFHPYTNNIASVVVDKMMQGEWYLKLLLSMIILHIFILLKIKFENFGIFKYV